jgi:hypothetical protein
MQVELAVPSWTGIDTSWRIGIINEHIHHAELRVNCDERRHQTRHLEGPLLEMISKNSWHWRKDRLNGRLKEDQNLKLMVHRWSH